jgi:protein ImuB
VATVRGGRRVVAVDAAAAAAGIAPGLPLAVARALVPGLAVLPADPAGEAAALARLAAWCGAFSPWTAPETGEGTDPRDGALPDPPPGAGAGGLWLDVTGCAHLFGGEAGLLRGLVGRLARLGFTARAGLAGTPGAAWAVARFAPGSGAEGKGGGDPAAGRVVPPGGEWAALAPMPAAALRLPADIVDGLARLGLRRVGDLVDLPRGPLVARFGHDLARRLDQAFGRVAEPLSPRAAPPPLRVRLAPAEPLGYRDGIALGLERLLRRLATRLERQGLGARRVEFALYHVDGTVSGAAVGTSRPVRDAAHLRGLFAPRLEGLAPGFGVEAMVLSAPRVEPLAAVQAALPGAGRRSGERAAGGDGTDGSLAALVDRLENRLGAGAVMRFEVRESHLPERAAAPVAVFAAAPAPAPRSPVSPSPRPVRLLPRPEPIEAVAAVPDGPPAMFRWRRVLHRIARAEGPERIAPEWWRGSAPWDAPWDLETRDYYRVEDAAGGRFWVFREGLYRMPGETPADPPRWYLHGLFA